MSGAEPSTAEGTRKRSPRWPDGARCDSVLYRRNERLPFARTATKGRASRILRIADHNYISPRRSNFDTLAVAQAVTGLPPVRRSQTRSRQQHAVSYLLWIHVDPNAETRQITPYRQTAFAWRGHGWETRRHTARSLSSAAWWGAANRADLPDAVPVTGRAGSSARTE